MLDKVRESFLKLLRIGLWNDVKFSVGFAALESEEWEIVYKMSVAQTVEGLVYEGIMKLPDHLLPSHNQLLKWVIRIDLIERLNERNEKVLAHLSLFLKKNEVDFMLLKGAGLGKLYPIPTRRIPGDIDLYFNGKKSYERALSLIKSKGIIVEKGALKSCNYLINQVEVEHHSRLFDIMNPFKQGYLKDIEKKEVGESIEYIFENQKVKTPSYFLSHIQANAHILKHILGFGIGLRQFCDVARLCYVSKNNIDGKALLLVYKKLGIDNFMNLMYDFLVRQLGLDSRYLPYLPAVKLDSSNWLMNEVLEVGNFGFYDKRYSDNDEVDNKPNYERNNMIKRVVPNWIKTFKLAPYETICFPLSKIIDKIER